MVSMYRRGSRLLFAGILALLCSCGSPKAEHIPAIRNDPAYEKLQKSCDEAKQRDMLQSARNGIFRFWDKAVMPELPPPGANAGLAIRLLVRGRDRGCLAWYRNTGDPALFAEYCAVQALQDPRYEPLRPDEAAETLLELALFGDWEDIASPGDFIPGYHSLRLVDGVHDTILQASLVPQRQYTKEAFLEALCVKAGLDRNAWKEHKTLQWQRSPCLWRTEPLELR
jgi:AMMECR1 domain-containing protein